MDIINYMHFNFLSVSDLLSLLSLFSFYSLLPTHSFYLSFSHLKTASFRNPLSNFSLSSTLHSIWQIFNAVYKFLKVFADN